ncbi:hypothetical protein CsSME_00032849 [Camellia sinensis var. sinensis]
MEREKRNKRARESGRETTELMKNAKKLDLTSTHSDEYDKENSFNSSFHDDPSNNMTTSSGIFDFPWLKEGMIFKSDDTGLEFEDAFASCSCPSINPTASPALESPGHSFCMSATTLQNIHDNNKIADEDDLWSFKVDELDGTDWIWSSLILDQPLAVGFNKV